MVQTPKSEVTCAASRMRRPMSESCDAADSLCIQLVSPNGPSGAAVVVHRGNKVTAKEVCVIGGAH
jgi:hypothetical protein